MSDHPLGTISTQPAEQPRQMYGYTLNDLDPTDVFSFEFNDYGSINVGLDSLTGNTNVKLYRDSNDNGTVDASDQLLATGQDNNMLGGGDEAINFTTATQGKYLVEVYRGASLGNLFGGSRSYNLDISATPAGTASNVVPSEFQVGTLSHYQVKFFNGNISTTNTADVYAFSTSPDVGVEVKLSGLGSNANIRLIKDLDKDGVVDYGEEKFVSQKLGTASELIKTSVGGDYLLQVYRGSGSATNYNLQIETKPTLGLVAG